jgi:hypothetical protein
VFGWLQADTVAAVWTAAAAIHREKNTVEAAAAAGLQPQQAAANKLQAACRIAMPAHACAADGVKVRRIILLATVTSAFDLVPSGSGWGRFVRALARFGSNRPGSATTCKLQPDVVRATTEALSGFGEGRMC